MHAWGYMRSEMQALPLVAGRVHRIGRKPDSDLCLKVPHGDSTHQTRAARHWIFAFCFMVRFFF